MGLNQAFEYLREHDRIVVGADWFQGRSLFGGVTAALMLVRLQHILDKPRQLRSMTVNFVGPVDAAAELILEARILRVGKSVLQGEVYLKQNDNVYAVLLAAFGEPRLSDVQQPAPAFAEKWPLPEQLAPAEDLNGLALPFLRYLDLRWAAGAEAFSGAKLAEFGAYTRLREQSGAFTLAHLVVLADGFPPAPSVMLDKIAPLSSLTWTLECVRQPEDMDMADFWRYQVHTDAAADGYGHTEARMWDKYGRLTLISRQTVTVFG